MRDRDPGLISFLIIAGIAAFLLIVWVGLTLFSDVTIGPARAAGLLALVLVSLIPIGLFAILIFGLIAGFGRTRRPGTPDAVRPTCYACGQGIEAGWRVCPHCGAELENRQIDETRL